MYGILLEDLSLAGMTSWNPTALPRSRDKVNAPRVATTGTMAAVKMRKGHLFLQSRGMAFLPGGAWIGRSPTRPDQDTLKGRLLYRTPAERKTQFGEIQETGVLEIDKCDTRPGFLQPARTGIEKER
jgi:hypothetical protein